LCIAPFYYFLFVTSWCVTSSSFPLTIHHQPLVLQPPFVVLTPLHFVPWSKHCIRFEEYITRPCTATPLPLLFPRQTCQGDGSALWNSMPCGYSNGIVPSPPLPPFYATRRVGGGRGATPVHGRATGILSGSHFPPTLSQESPFRETGSNWMVAPSGG